MQKYVRIVFKEQSCKMKGYAKLYVRKIIGIIRLGMQN